MQLTPEFSVPGIRESNHFRIDSRDFFSALTWWLYGTTYYIFNIFENRLRAWTSYPSKLIEANWIESFKWNDTVSVIPNMHLVSIPWTPYLCLIIMRLLFLVLQESVSQVRPLVICHCNPADSPAAASDNHAGSIWPFSLSLPLLFFLFLLPLFISIIIVFFSFLFPRTNTWHPVQQIPQGIFLLLLSLVPTLHEKHNWPWNESVTSDTC